LLYFERKSREQEDVIEELRKRESYTTLKYGMLINQNHELSIKLKNKKETISNLNNLIKNGIGENKVSQHSTSEFRNEDNGYESEFK